MNDASASTKAQFQAYYLQRATAELAEDLDALRTADDFAMTTTGQAKAAAATRKNARTPRNAGDSQATGSASASPAAATAAASTPAVFDSPLQMLIEALRQGADMFLDEDQKRVVMAGADEESMRK